MYCITFTIASYLLLESQSDPGSEHSDPLGLVELEKTLSMGFQFAKKQPSILTEEQSVDTLLAPIIDL